jgi:hypothetical protein
MKVILASCLVLDGLREESDECFEAARQLESLVGLPLSASELLLRLEQLSAKLHGAAGRLQRLRTSLARESEFSRGIPSSQQLELLPSAEWPGASGGEWGAPPLVPLESHKGHGVFTSLASQDGSFATDE